MAKKTVIAGSTVSAQQLKDFFRQIADGGITHLHMQAILERRNPFPDCMVKKAGTNIITVLADIPLVSRIATCRLDYDSIIDNSFPHDPTTVGEWEWKKFQFDSDDMSSEAVITAMNAEGYRPASLEHILAFHEKYPEGEEGDTLVALGSSCVIDCYRSVPYLSYLDESWVLLVSNWDGAWGGDVFLAVR